MKLILFIGLILIQSSPEDHIQGIRLAIQEGDLETAEQKVESLALEDPEDARVFYWRAVIFGQRNDWTQAESAARKALTQDKSLVPAYLLMAELYQTQNRLSDAMAILKKGLETQPEAFPLLYRLAKLHAEQADFKQALNELHKIEVETAPSEYWATLGSTYLMTDQIGNAERAFQQYLSREPESVRTLQMLAAISLKKNDPSTAWDFIARARRIAPNSPQILYDFAHISKANNLVSEAVTALRFLLIMEPDRPEYLFELGSALIRLADFRAAVDYFQRYVSLRPQEGQGHAMLGYALYLGNDHQEARRHFLNALSRDPKLIDARYYLGMIDYQLGKHREAESTFKDVLQESQDYGRAYLGLGKLYLRQRRFQDALRELTRASRLMPQDYDVHFQLNRVYSLLGEEEKARTSLETYQRLKEAQDRYDDQALRTPYSGAAVEQGP